MNIISNETYGDMKEFLSKLQRPVNSHFKSMGCASHNTDGDNFSGTSTYEEALELLVSGKWSGVETLKGKMKTIEKIAVKHQKKVNQTITSVVGFHPCVPNAVIGRPDSMYDMKKIRIKEDKIVNLTYFFGVSAATSQDKILNRGAMVLSAISYLEKMGYRVNLYLGKGNVDGGTVSTYSVKVKDSRDVMDLKKYAFMIAHPSMLRRISFRQMETAPTILSGFYGYGSPLGNHREYWGQISKALKRNNSSCLFSPALTEYDYISEVTAEQVKELAEKILSGGHIKKEG